jgi:hypothetical protein
LERRKAVRVSVSPFAKAKARRDDNKVAPRGAPFPSAFEGRERSKPRERLCGTRRPFIGARGTSVQPPQREKHFQKIRWNPAAHCRAQAGNRKITQRWRLSLLYGKVFSGRMNGQSLVA